MAIIIFGIHLNENRSLRCAALVCGGGSPLRPRASAPRWCGAKVSATATAAGAAVAQPVPCQFSSGDLRARFRLGRRSDAGPSESANDRLRAAEAAAALEQCRSEQTAAEIIGRSARPTAGVASCYFGAEAAAPACGALHSPAGGCAESGRSPPPPPPPSPPQKVRRQIGPSALANQITRVAPLPNEAPNAPDRSAIDSVHNGCIRRSGEGWCCAESMALGAEARFRRRRRRRLRPAARGLR